jgi:hypothetical protein
LRIHDIKNLKGGIAMDIIELMPRPIWHFMRSFSLITVDRKATKCDSMTDANTFALEVKQ